MRARDFLTIRDFDSDELLSLLALARDIKASPGRFAESLKGRTLALIFEKPSLRTRVSFDVGIQQLGGFSVYLSPAEINLGKRESLPDVARNLERMVQGIMIRTFGHDIVVQMAAHANIPVINGLTDFSHPCQAMADFLTIAEIKGALEGLRLAYVGDANNVSNSLMFAAARFGVHVAIGSPAGYQPSPEVTDWARAEGARTGSTCRITDDPAEAVADADVVYTDAWASMGRESESDLRKKVFRSYQVNASLFAQARPDALFMHCLPAHRGDEVTDDVIDSRQSVVFQQAENRLHVQKAIMLELMRSP